jgi:formylglycine-generating enzyme required for sulfatase activity
VCDGCGTPWDKRSTVPVDRFPPNRFGLHNMLDNVMEWTADCWSHSHADAPRDGSARRGDEASRVHGTCVRPVKRGGSYDSFAWTVRAAHRSSWRPGPWSDRESNYGFRVVRDLTAADTVVLPADSFSRTTDSGVRDGGPAGPGNPVR